jgi:hypothetical protein
MRLVPAALVVTVALAVLRCSSTPANSTPSPAQGPCGDGYLEAVNGVCPKGTCLESEASASCCGSQCATCEAKGLISQDDGGACPPGTCVSADLTVLLSCCDTCAGVEDASADAPVDAAGDGGVEAAIEAAPESGANDATGD